MHPSKQTLQAKKEIELPNPEKTAASSEAEPESVRDGIPAELPIHVLAPRSLFLASFTDCCLSAQMRFWCNNKKKKKKKKKKKEAGNSKFLDAASLEGET